MQALKRTTWIKTTPQITCLQEISKDNAAAAQQKNFTEFLETPCLGPPAAKMR
jgi:hypothetical protein